jgi:hypothetical protein
VHKVFGPARYKMKVTQLMEEDPRVSHCDLAIHIEKYREKKEELTKLK